MEDEEYLPEFKAFERAYFFSGDNKYARDFSVYKSSEIALKICEAVAMSFKGVWSGLKIDSNLVGNYTSSLNKIPFIQYKNPAGLFLGWLVSTQYNGDVEVLKPYINSVSWPEKSEKLTLLEIFRYSRLWRTV